jgi:hypothetical protein
MIRNSWGHAAVRGFWSAGFQAGPIMRIFNELSPALHAAIGHAIDSAQFTALCAAKHADCTDHLHPAEKAKSPQHQAEEAAAQWENDSVHAFIELHFDPATQMRVAGACNARAASLLGMEQHELLDRLQRDDVPLPFAPIDAIAMFLHSLSVSRDDVNTCYHRLLLPQRASGIGTPPHEQPPSAALVCSTTVKAFDAHGRVHKVIPPRTPQCGTKSLPSHSAVRDEIVAFALRNAGHDPSRGVNRERSAFASASAFAFALAVRPLKPRCWAETRHPTTVV